MDALNPILRQWLGEALSQQHAGNYPAALLAYRRVLSRDPAQVDAWCNLGSVLREMGRRDEASEACERALALDPANTAALCILGCLKGDARDYEGAAEMLEKALALCPNHFPARFQMGWVLFHLGRLEEALEADDRAIALDGTIAAAHLNRGYTLMKLGRLPDAEASLLKALDLDEGLVLAHWTLAFVRLLDGRFEEAWPDYGWRWQISDARPHQRHFLQPLWSGEHFEGRTLLVWAEQGFGDTIQFVRYLPMVKELGGQVILQVQPALVSLVSTCPGVDLVTSEQQEPPAFDLQVPILTLPEIFRSTLETLPRHVPYLAVPASHIYEPGPGLVEALQENGRIRIGLVWCGNPNQKDNASRSLDPGLFEPLAQLPNVSWFSLQKYLPEAESRSLPEALHATELGPELSTFADTAYALERLHLLISVDTSVAHLAGALARPAMVLLSFSPDWRWLLKGDRCPWYPTLRLYRQPKPGDWAPVIQDILRDFA